MNEKPIPRLEAQLEKLIEGALTQLFSKALKPHDVALSLSRAMESGVEAARDGDPRPFAPDQYNIRVNAGVQGHLLAHQPDLASILTQHVIDLAALAGYRLRQQPTVTLIADATCSPTDIVVGTRHSRTGDQTVPMYPVKVPAAPTPRRAQLIIDGSTTMPLTEAVINIGRGKDNHLLINDPHVSRHHAQLRLRFGGYTLFDIQSQGGTLVNDVRIYEHRLQSGDVIRIGKTQILYLEERGAEAGTQTGILPALDV